MSLSEIKQFQLFEYDNTMRYKRTRNLLKYIQYADVSKFLTHSHYKRKKKTENIQAFE